MKNEIENAIKETLVISNPESIWRAADKITEIVDREQALDTSNVVEQSEQCDHDYQPCKHEAVSEFDKCTKCGKII